MKTFRWTAPIEKGCQTHLCHDFRGTLKVLLIPNILKENFKNLKTEIRKKNVEKFAAVFDSVGDFKQQGTV